MLPCRWLPIAICIAVVASGAPTPAAAQTESSSLVQQLHEHCLDCHSGSEPEGGFDLTFGIEQLASRGKPQVGDLAAWIKIHDRVAAGEMPPDGGLPTNQRDLFVNPLHKQLVELDRQAIRV